MAMPLYCIVGAWLIVSKHSQNAVTFSIAIEAVYWYKSVSDESNSPGDNLQPL